MSEPLFLPSFRMDSHGNLYKSECLNMAALKETHMPKKIAYFVAGPPKLDWQTTPELLDENIPYGSTWIYCCQQATMADAKFGGDWQRDLEAVAKAAEHIEFLVIECGYLTHGADWVEFAAKSGLLAQGFKCILLTRWNKKGDSVPLWPLGNWEIIGLVPNWENRRQFTCPGIVRLPDEHDNYLLDEIE